MDTSWLTLLSYLAVGAIGGWIPRLTDGFFYKWKLWYDYKMELNRRRLDAYEKLAQRAVFFARDKRGLGSKITEANEVVRLAAPYGSQEVLDLAQNVLEEYISFSEGATQNDPEMIAHFEKYLYWSSRLLTQIRTELSETKPPKLGQLLVNPPASRGTP